VASPPNSGSLSCRHEQPGGKAHLGDPKAPSRHRRLERLIRPTMALETPPECLNAKHGWSARERGPSNEPMEALPRRGRQEPCQQDRRETLALSPREERRQAEEVPIDRLQALPKKKEKGNGYWSECCRKYHSARSTKLLEALSIKLGTLFLRDFLSSSRADHATLSVSSIKEISR